MRDKEDLEEGGAGKLVQRAFKWVWLIAKGEKLWELRIQFIVDTAKF